MKFMFLISILIPSILTIITAAFRLCVGHEVREVGLETGNNAMIPPDPAALRSTESCSHAERLLIGIGF